MKGVQRYGPHSIEGCEKNVEATVSLSYLLFITKLCIRRMGTFYTDDFPKYR